jgi:hypothetical protein
VGEKYHFLLNTTKFMEIVIDKISHKILVFFFENPKHENMRILKSEKTKIESSQKWKQEEEYIYIYCKPAQPPDFLAGGQRCH